MTTLAEQISGTRLDSRLEVANNGDELGHLARTFNSMLDRLQRSMDELQRFTADAAHELRTPLAVLQTEAEVALRTPRSADEYRRVVEVTLDESKRLAQLVARLLELARRDCQSHAPHREKVPLGSLLADVVEQFRPAADQQGVSIRFDPASDPVVEGDDVGLSQLLFNLMDNAVKFTQRGGQVAVQCERLADSAQVTISDTGVGLSPTDLPHVFERFYQADKSRNGRTPGAGLGLAIAKAIVEAHHGGIEIHQRAR